MVRMVGETRHWGCHTLFFFFFPAWQEKKNNTEDRGLARGSWEDFVNSHLNWKTCDCSCSQMCVSWKVLASDVRWKDFGEVPSSRPSKSLLISESCMHARFSKTREGKRVEGEFGG